MGSPKALLRYRGATFLEHIVATIESCPGIVDRVLVVGRHEREIRAHAGDVRVVVNPDYAQGMTTSFQAGIRALPREVGHVIVFLVDHPTVTPETVRLLLARVGRADVVVPNCGGRRGHPVVFSRRFMDEILMLPADLGVNSLVASDPDRVREVPVGDPGVLCDIDTPDDFEKLLRERDG